MIFLIPALLAGYCCDCLIDRKLRPVRYPQTVWLSLLSFASLYFTHCNTVIMIQGLLFAQFLIACGYNDVVKREIPDELVGLIFLVSLIRFDPKPSFFGMLLVSIPLWIIGTVFHGSVGGGDIKLFAACGAVLGPAGIITSVVLSCFAFLIFFLIRSLLRRKREKTYAMAPWIGSGCFIAFYFVKGC